MDDRVDNGLAQHLFRYFRLIAPTRALDNGDCAKIFDDGVNRLLYNLPQRPLALHSIEESRLAGLSLVRTRMNGNIDHELGEVLLGVYPRHQQPGETDLTPAVCNVETAQLFFACMHAAQGLRVASLLPGNQGVKDDTVKIGQTCFRNRLAIGSRRDQNVLQLIKFRWGQPDVLVVNTLVAPVRNAPARDKARLETYIELGNFNDENLTSLKRQTMQLIVRGIGEGGIIGASIPNARNESIPDSFEGNRRYWGETGLFLKTQNDSPPRGYWQRR